MPIRSRDFTALKGGFSDLSAEETVHAIDEEEGFVVVEVAVFVELLEFGGGGLSFFVAILLEREQGSTQTAESVEHAEIIMGVGLEVVFVRARGELIKLLGELSDGELETNEGKIRGVIVASHFEQALL